MATEVVMPQMGESIAEGTIVRWIKKVGDKVDRDEPLFEISTDKVDAEIPSPAAGVVSEIRVKEGETVPINTVVATIGSAAAAAAAATADKDKAAAPAPAPTPAEPLASTHAEEPPKPKPQADGSGGQERQDRQDRQEGSASAAPRPVAATARQAATSTEEALHQRSSPLVRRIAKEHNVDITQIHGTGIAGRVTKDDILGFLGQDGRDRQDRQDRQEGKKTERAAERSAPSPQPPAPKSGDRVEKMSPMRKKISEHMVLSRRTSAHVHSVFEVNFSKVEKIRQARKAEFERSGAKLTYLSFILKAAIDALRAMPIINSSVDGESIVYHQEINVGIAVALDWGLIVPVVKHADTMNLVGLSKAVVDLAGRARTKQLKPEEVGGGTFTITNPGVFGALFGMPIINQPQVAILGVGAVEKRAVVVDDAIAIRPMAYLTLGYDHRVIDGAVADEFMSHIKKSIENWDPNAV